jgi:ABC-2 type transport system ATP-binding protein
MISAPVSTGATALIETLRSLDIAGIHPLDVSLKRPSLDDVFLSLTGHAAEEKKEEEVETPDAERRQRNERCN